VPAETSTSADPGQRKWWIIAAVGISIGVAIAVWFGVSASTGRPLWNDVGYQVKSDRVVRVTYDLTRPVGSKVVCTVRALDVHHGTAGSITVTVPPAQEKTTRETTMVQTTHRAVTGLVDTCVFPGQDGSSS
jgi:hypothetical protein